MKKLATITSALVLASVAALAACTGTTNADGTDKNALPQAETSSTTTKAPPTTKSKAPAKPAASTCDVAREAILTGSVKQIEAAMKKLQADKKADADAREAARNYLQTKDKDLREMYVSLVQMSCSI